MLTVKFKVNAKVAGYGIVSAGQLRDFEDEDYANQLIKDGLAEVYQRVGVESQESELESEESPIVLEDLDDDQLKALAKDAKIAGYTKMDRAALIAAIVKADEQAD